MARAEDLRAVRRFLEESRHRIDMQLMDLDSMIRRAEHATPVPVLNPGRRADDMPLPKLARTDGVQLQVLDLGPRVECGPFDDLPRETPALVGMGEDCCDDWHGAMTIGRNGEQA